MSRKEKAEANRARVLKLVGLGLRDDEIREATGLSLNRIGVIRRQAGIVYHPHGRPSQEIIDEIIERATVDEWPSSEIAATLGVSKDTVYTFRPRETRNSEWNTVSRWAARTYPDLYRELMHK